MAGCAVVALIFCIDDALDRRLTNRAGFAEPAVDGHPGPKCGDFGRKVPGGFRANRFHPMSEAGARGVE